MNNEMLLDEINVEIMPFTIFIKIFIMPTLLHLLKGKFH